MKMRRNVVRLNREHLVRLDEISAFASGVLDREVSRAAVIRAALDEWLASRAALSPGDVVESILSGIVKRGRLSFDEMQRESDRARAGRGRGALAESADRAEGAEAHQGRAKERRLRMRDPQKLFDKLIDTHEEIRHKDS